MRKHFPLLVSALLGVVSVLIILLRIGFPHHRSIALTTYAIGWAFFIVALRRYRSIAKAVGRARGFVYGRGRCLLVGLLLAVLGYVGWVIFPVQETDFFGMDETARTALVEHDFQRAGQLITSIEHFKDDATVRELLGTDYGSLTTAQHEQLLSFWAAYLDHVLALEQLKQRHRHFYQINYLKYPELNLKSFLTAYASFIAIYKNSLYLREAIGDNDSLAALLDEEHGDLGIPGKSYYRLMQGLTSPDSLVMLNAGRANLKFLKEFGDRDDTRSVQLREYAENGYGTIYKLLGQEPGILVDNPLAFYENTTFKIWFPFQKNISEAMGDIRTTHRQNLISPEQAHAARTRLEPGDIMLERRNWYLSNIGLPGFWPHAALYTGDLTELDAYFDGLDELQGQTFSQYLQEHFPEAYTGYRDRSHGYAPSVVEAVSEGVIQHVFEESAAADYVAILRPKRLTRSDKFHALLTAYSFLGRPYDFNFDFTTDNELVCSEVVCKAYAPSEIRDGLYFELTTTAGRLVLQPNNIIKKFDEEFGTPQQELGFVLFLDGSEEDGVAYEHGAEALRASWQRPKWDIMQQ